MQDTLTITSSASNAVQSPTQIENKAENGPFNKEDKTQKIWL